MEQLAVIKGIVDKLGKNDIAYFITGSIAGAYYGIPRFTHDIDIVINIKKGDAGRIVSLFVNDGYISKEGIINAFAGQKCSISFMIKQAGKLTSGLIRAILLPYLVLAE